MESSKVYLTMSIHVVTSNVFVVRHGLYRQPGLVLTPDFKPGWINHHANAAISGLFSVLGTITQSDSNYHCEISFSSLFVEHFQYIRNP